MRRTALVFVAVFMRQAADLKRRRRSLLQPAEGFGQILLQCDDEKKGNPYTNGYWTGKRGVITTVSNRSHEKAMIPFDPQIF
ncbi:hypothetical protein TNCV_2206851 [Trichonephila clavipes]|uniref:Uncharacterized protein n=1 Tax=Trichonephila clavipes TaxID=2585209 RepID=A0A8X6VAB9_TRICX|nr:hypothetical protein TNCV_2206851 [Trichonephila clavipes]